MSKLPSTPAVRILLLTGVLVAGAALLIFYDLGASSLHNTDEAGHSIVAQEILENGDWITLTFLGEPYFKKPPLKFWLAAVTYDIGGLSEFTVRLWSAIFALGTVLFLFWLGRGLYGDRAAFLGALVLLTTHQFLYNHCARTGELDSALLFFWTSAHLLFLLAIARSSERLLLLAFASIGLAGMVKHIGFVPQILLIIGLQLAITRGWRRFRARSWLKAGGLLLLVVLPWHIAQTVRHGRAFLDSYILGEVVARAAGEVPVSHTTDLGAWFYAVVLKNGFFPWTLLLPFALVLACRRTSLEKKRIDLALVAWVAIALLIPTLSEAKNFWYALPALPPAALLIGRLLDRHLESARSRWIELATIAMSALALLSTTTASIHNPFATRARHEMVSVDLFGRLADGHVAVWLAVAAAIVAVGWLVSKWRSGRWAFVLLFIGIASFQATSPLKFTKSRNSIDRIVDAALAEQKPRESFVLALPNKVQRPIRNLYYFRQLGPDVEIIGRSDLAKWRMSMRKPALLITTAPQARWLEREARRLANARRTRILRHEPPFDLVRLRKYRSGRSKTAKNTGDGGNDRKR
jgi:4-amino-4-deoxy-L-arabinose transferase-like glycosyltransferase